MEGLLIAKNRAALLANVDFVGFPNRIDRVRYAAETFRHFINGKVLDVGCDTKTLKQLRPDLEYTGIDINGNPDIVLDLDKTQRLPFDDSSFDTVVCIEVLEHLDALHSAFAELARVSRRYIVISLPNCWAVARKRVARGEGPIGHYGLPAIPPLDRHKWFFSLSEACEFLLAATDQHGLRIVDARVTEKPRPAATRLARRVWHPNRECYLNLYAHTLWTVLEHELTGRS